MDNIIATNSDYNENEAGCSSYDEETGICLQDGKVCNFCEDVLNLNV